MPAFRTDAIKAKHHDPDKPFGQFISMTAKLVFDDEFSSLNTRASGAGRGTWDTQLWWGPNVTINNEQQYYVDVTNNGTNMAGGNNPFSISDGFLSIAATPAKPGTSNGQAFNSGVMTTEHSFARTYGYFEISARMPAGAGTAPAFWLLNASHQWPPELDVVEEIGRQPTDIVGTVHTGSSNKAYPFFLTTPDVTAGFHAYGVDWQADKITWYFDGKPYGSIATPSDMHSPMYMVMNLAIGGAWPGSPPNPGQLHAAYKIDYVRVWEGFPGAAATSPASMASPMPQVATDTLVLSLAEDAWQGDAQAIITIDGKAVGDPVSVTALHGMGQSQAVTLTGQWGAGAHDVGIQFLNDAYGGTPETDRNLYVEGVTFDGQAAAGQPAVLHRNGAVSVATAASPLVLRLSEDAWRGDAQFSVAVDGKTLGAAQPVTALHATGATQNFAFAPAMATGTHDVAVSFLNDAYGGTTAADRNLYVDAITANGATMPGTAASLVSTSTQHFSVVVAAQGQSQA